MSASVQDTLFYTYLIYVISALNSWPTALLLVSEWTLSNPCIFPTRHITAFLPLGTPARTWTLSWGWEVSYVVKSPAKSTNMWERWHPFGCERNTCYSMQAGTRRHYVTSARNMCISTFHWFVPVFANDCKRTRSLKSWTIFSYVVWLSSFFICGLPVTILGQIFLVICLLWVNL